MMDIITELRAGGCGEYCDHLERTAADEIERLLAENEAIRADRQWRPIESAPKDGTEVLLYYPARGVVRGWFSDERFANKPRPYWRFGAANTRADQPTHWMPLPAPPKPD